MYLSDRDIIRAIKKKEITIDPFEERFLQPASYDIRLGNKFVVNDSNITHYIDPVHKIYAKTREIKVADGKEFVLHPNVSVLGLSQERFGSSHYLIQLSGKSSLARIGLMVHNTAGLINPGHYLNITFELCNLNNVPIILRPGMTIAQLIFAEMSSPPMLSYDVTGRYGKNNWDNFAAEPKRSNAVEAKAPRKTSIKKEKKK